MKAGRGNKGFVKVVLALAVLVALVFVGISFGKPYYRYNTLRSHTKDILMQDLGNTQAIRERIMADAKELNVPLKDENLEITTKEKVVRVKASWSETVDFWGYYQKEINFVMEEEG